MVERSQKAGPIGRLLRLFVAICLVIIDVPVLLRAGSAYNLASLGLVAALVMFYMIVHFVVSKYLPNLNRWLGAVLALTPVFLVWFFGQGGGPLFGQGEGGTAAITFVALSLLVDVMRADSGCEVMAIPGLILGNRTHLACLAFCPIDALEKANATDTT